MPDITIITFEQLHDICFNRWEHLCLKCENNLTEKCTSDNCIEWKNLINLNKGVVMGQTKDEVLGLEDIVSEELTDQVKEENLVVNVSPKASEPEVVPEVATEESTDEPKDI